MQCYLSTGSNMGTRVQALQEAHRRITTVVGTVTKASRIYETEAWGLEAQPAFLNQVLEVQTSLHPEDLLNALLKIEAEMGRERRLRWGPRLIDIDVLCIGDLIWNSPTLSLPHPHLQERNFVLYPLAEICPAWLHPVLKKDLWQLLEECKDPLAAKPWQQGGVSKGEDASPISD